MLTTWPHLVHQVPDSSQEPQAATSKLPHEPNLPPAVATCLGERLRAHYAHLMNDPVPEHLMRILEAMDGTRSTNNGH